MKRLSLLFCFLALLGTARATDFEDPSFVDNVVRRRASYMIADFNGDTRILMLLAEAITAPYPSDRERILALQKWVSGMAVIHHGINVPGRNDFYRSNALEIIRRGYANCEGTAEVFATLAWLAGYPSRVLSIQVEAPDQASVYGHHVNEVFVNGKWVFIDSDLYRHFELSDGSPANVLDLHEHPNIVVETEAHRPKFDGSLSFSNEPWIREFYTKKNLFDTIWVQEGIYSLDGEYGRWIKLTAETKEYLYSGPKNPDAVRLLKERLPFIYLRDSTKIDDHFRYRWDSPWNRYGP